MKFLKKGNAPSGLKCADFVGGRHSRFPGASRPKQTRVRGRNLKKKLNQSPMQLAHLNAEGVFCFLRAKGDFNLFGFVSDFDIRYSVLGRSK